MDRTSSEGSKINGTKPNVFRLLTPYRLMVLFLILMALIGSGINLFIPKLIANNIDDYSAGTFQLDQLMIEFLGAALGIFIFTLLQNLLQVYTSERVARDLRSAISDKISRQSYTYVLESNPSKLLTNLTSDVDSIKMFVSQAVVTIVSSLFMIIGTFILLLSINWKLALTVISIVPIIGATFYVIFKKVRVLFKRGREIIDMLNQVINESIMGAALIRVINSQQPETVKFLAVNQQARSVGLSILYLFSTLIPVIMFVSNLAMVSILALGGHYVVLGEMTLGSFAAFNSYLAMLIFPVLMIGFMSNIIAQASASYQRIYNVLEVDEVKPMGSVKGAINGDFTLREVSLFYGDKPVLKHLTFRMKAGSRTAIIGPTAAGKSQLLYLLSDLITPTSGNIELDGNRLDLYDKELFHQQMGLVFQDSVMFNMTLRENIAFRDHVTDESLQKAIETAELTDFVNALPLGLNTIVSERGTSLSGGEKQRIMLARALAVNPRILMLDDFTSRVDRKTEERILSNLARNYPDLTLISVTQKIASVRLFDQIILLMEGEIVAIGTHQELKNSSPEYMQIYESQKSTQHYEV